MGITSQKTARETAVLITTQMALKTTADVAIGTCATLPATYGLTAFAFDVATSPLAYDDEMFVLAAEAQPPGKIAALALTYGSNCACETCPAAPLIAAGELKTVLKNPIAAGNMGQEVTRMPVLRLIC